MKILNINYIEDESKLIENIRKTKLMGSDFEVYKDSTIELKKFNPEFLYPCQKYVLEKQLKIIDELASILCCSYGINIEKLRGYVEIETEQGWFTLTPPIVERDSSCNGKVNIINDGMHRVSWSMHYGTNINCIYIENPCEVYYAYPVTWNEVEVFEDTIPEDFVKKYHRIKRYKTLYRDFNTAFRYHVGSPRGKGKQ